MSGRIKAGEGSLIGNAGEHFVVAELLKRGIVAALAPRNTADFDVLATNVKLTPHKTVQIRVKTKSGQHGRWLWNAKKDSLTILPHLQNANDFTVLVNLTEETKDMDYFVIPSLTLNAWLESDWKAWLDKPGRRGQRHSEINRLRAFGDKDEHQVNLDLYLNNWGILWE